MDQHTLTDAATHTAAPSPAPPSPADAAALAAGSLPLVDIGAASRLLGCSRATAHALVAAGRLKPVRIDPKGKLRFQVKTLVEFVISHQR